MRSTLKNVLARIGALKASPLAALGSADRELIAKIRAERLTYLTDEKLACIVSTCRAIRRRGLPGLFIEAGCALGGSAILITSIKEPTRTMRVYDVFGMIPPPTAEDTEDVHRRYAEIIDGKSRGIGGDTYYGYQPDLYDVVQSNFAAFGIDPARANVALVKGMVQDTLQVEQPVAFAHVDVDWYEPVMTCLARIYPKLAVGGSIVLDDYHDWGGCRKATDEFLRKVAGSFELDDAAGSMKVTKVRALQTEVSAEA